MAAKGGVRSQLKKLHTLFGGKCHYCGVSTELLAGSGKSKRATRDHVVPRSLGGDNAMENYVLSCAECNVKRGTTLFFCTCSLCKGMIDSALSGSKSLEALFDKIMSANKPRIRRVPHRKPWNVAVAGKTYSFYTHREAINFVFDTSRPCSEY